MCADQGKDKLEWYRTVDAAKLEHLKEMMAADNYKENLGTLIRYGPGVCQPEGPFGGKQEICKNKQISSR